MLRTLLVAIALTLVLAPAAQAQAPCAPDGGERALDRSDEVVLLRDGRRYLTCTIADGSRWNLPDSVAVRPLLAGPYVLMFLGDRNDGDLVLGDAPTQEQITVDRGAFSGVAVDSSGRVVAVRRTKRRERVIARDLTGGRTILSSARGRVSRLRLDNGTVSWRRSGARRSRELPEPSCDRPPRGATSDLADEALVVTSRTTSDEAEETSTTTIWTCLRTDGRFRLMAQSGSDLGGGSSTGGFVRAGGLLGFTQSGYSRYGFSDVSSYVFDPATATRVGFLAGSLVALAEDGRLATLRQATETTSRLLAAGTDGQERTLDEAPNGQLTDVVLEPGIVRWRRGGAVQSAPLT